MLVLYQRVNLFTEFFISALLWCGPKVFALPLLALFRGAFIMM